MRIDLGAVLGEPRVEHEIDGLASLDLDLRWSVLEIRFDGAERAYVPPAEALVDLAGAPALYGLAARRLEREGLRPGEGRDLEILRIAADGDARTIPGRCVWVGGRNWRLLARGEATDFSVRPDGVVAGVQGAAELIERG